MSGDHKRYFCEQVIFDELIGHGEEKEKELCDKYRMNSFTLREYADEAGLVKKNGIYYDRH